MKTAPFLIGIFIALTAATAAAEPASLHGTFSRRAKPVPVSVDAPVNKTDDVPELAAGLHAALKEKLAARYTPKFTVLEAGADNAELSISAEIVESVFSEHDPVDKLIGIGGTAWDAANVEHYARITAVYTVKDVRTGRTLWTDKLKATVTDKTMTREESRPKVTARAAEIFIREAFGKKRK